MASYVHDIIVWDDAARATGLKGDFVRDEHEQANYVREVLDVFAAEGIDAAFVYTFARYDLPHRDDRAADLDMASAGVVKVLDGTIGLAIPAAGGTPTCRGNRRRRSTRWPSGLSADDPWVAHR